jgi:mannosyltransferase OCH1-like enzyme
LVNYTILGNKIENGDTNYIVRINTIDRLLKKSVVNLTRQNADSLGKDPIDAKSFWFGNGFLNVTFAFKQDQKIHLIDLAKDTIQPSTGEVALQLLHNAWGDNTFYERSGFVSFDLSSLLNGKDSVKVIVKSKDYSGVSHEFKGTYKKVQ